MPPRENPSPGTRRIPCIPDSYFISENAANFHGTELTTSRVKQGHTYIFPLAWPFQHCHGHLPYNRIQYCYQTNASHFEMDVDVFHFFGGCLSNNAFSTVYSNTVKSTPNNDICFMPEGSLVYYYCCDDHNIDIGIRMVPSTNAFGIKVIHSDVLPLAFVPSVSILYNVSHFQLSPGTSQPLTPRYDGIFLLRLFNRRGTQNIYNTESEDPDCSASQDSFSTSNTAQGMTSI